MRQRRAFGAVTYGGVVMRKRSGANWMRALYTLINARVGAASEQLAAFFESQTALQALPSPGLLLERHLRVAGGWRFDRRVMHLRLVGDVSHHLLIDLPPT